MSSLTVYQKPTCSTCRKLFTELEKRKMHFDKVDYIVTPLSKAKLTNLIAKLKESPRDIVRIKEPTFKKLKISPDSLTKTQVVMLLEKYPELMERPIVESGNKAVIARPVEKVRTLFS